jgi:Asp-tRNA(Asn)/Glu-tRNA(Gln) amidotransferase A subunit family amidase
VAALSAAGATLVGKVLTEALAFSPHGANVRYGSTGVSASCCGIWGLRDALG